MSAVVAELVKILPENEFLRVGQGLRYTVRWIRCQVFGSHSWVQITGALNLWGQPMSGTVQCRVRLKSLHY